MSIASACEQSMLPCCIVLADKLAHRSAANVVSEVASVLITSLDYSSVTAIALGLNQESQRFRVRMRETDLDCRSMCLLTWSRLFSSKGCQCV